MELILKEQEIELAGEKSLQDHALWMDNIDSIETFLTLLPDCYACPMRKPDLVRSRQNGPFGNLLADVMFILRNPHPSEIRYADRTSPADGRVGGRFQGVLDGMLEVMGLGWQEIYLTYANFCSTPSNRIPFRREVENCSGWKTWELHHLKNLRFIIPLGIDATQQLFGEKFPKVGTVFWDVYRSTLSDREVFVFPCHHPRYALQNDDLREPLAHWSRAVGDFIRDRRQR